MSTASEKNDYLFYSHRPLIVYGAGGAGEFIVQHLLKGLLRIDAICDQEPCKQGNLIWGIPVMALDEARRKFSDADFFIGLYPDKHEAIRSVLVQAGVPEERIFDHIHMRNTDLYMPPHLPKYWQFSICPYRDLYHFGASLADETSRQLFRLRYRHWILNDRPNNPNTDESSGINDVGGGKDCSESGMTQYDGIEELCDAFYSSLRLEGEGMEAEFANGDPLAPHILFMVWRYVSGCRIYLRQGSRLDRTVMRILAEGGFDVL